MNSAGLALAAGLRPTSPSGPEEPTARSAVAPVKIKKTRRVTMESRRVRGLGIADIVEDRDGIGRCAITNLVIAVLAIETAYRRVIVNCALPDLVKRLQIAGAQVDGIQAGSDVAQIGQVISR